MNKIGIIYKATCILTNKSYIGQTIQGLKKRKNDHIKRARYGKKNTYFYNAIRKYGIKNFEWEIVYDNIDQSKLNALEIMCIREEQTYAHNLNDSGYNSTLGGKANYGYKPTEETKAKLRARNIGKKHSAETRKQMSITRSGTNNSNAKLTKKQILDIITRLNAGELQKDIAKKYVICRQTVVRINNKSKASKRKLNKEQILNIVARLDAGEKIINIAKLYKINRGIISQINNGKSYNDITSRRE